MTSTDPIRIDRVGQTLMGLVNVLQDAPCNASEKETAVSCLFNIITATHRKELSTLRRSSWEFQQWAENVLDHAEGYPQFYAAEKYVQNDLRGLTV